MVEPRHRSLVGHRPRHFDIAIDLGRRKYGLKAWLLSRPHTQEYGGPPTQGASKLRQPSQPIRCEWEVMQDRNAQVLRERRISTRQLQQVAAEPIDARRHYLSP